MPGHAPDGGPDRWRTVIGVVGDVRYRGIDDVRLDVYDAALQARSVAGDLVVRTAGDPLDVVVAIQAEARGIDPRVVIDRVTTIEAIVSRAVAPWRFSAWMFTLFAIVAFALATVGLVSVAALDVTDRRREFAVRLAVGAERRDIRRVVLHRALWRVAPGLALGLLAALVGTRAIRHILFGVPSLDPATYAAVSALVIVTVVVASWWPAQRASGASPLVLLRRD
jgi:putative ABC transport system permease protein